MILAHDGGAGGTPVLSICIPTWNRRDTLVAQLERLAAQCPADWEVVVVDNGSDDGSLKAAIDVARRHPSCAITVWTNATNLGADLNYLRALESGRGEWLWLLGDDDGVDLTKAPVLRSALGASSEVAMLIPDAERDAFPSLPPTMDAAAFLRREYDRLGYIFHKLGTTIVRRSAALPHLREAYHRGVGHLHAYSVISLRLIDAGHLDIVTIPGLLLPQHAVAGATAPRWNGLAGFMGAWRTSQIGLPRHHRAASQREARLRSGTVLVALLGQMTDELGIARRHAWWAFGAASWRWKPFAATVLALALLPRPLSRRLVSALLRWRNKTHLMPVRPYRY